MIKYEDPEMVAKLAETRTAEFDTTNVLTLFEVTYGLCGESYLRSYAWARTAEYAEKLALRQFVMWGMQHGGIRWKDVKTRALFSADSPQFATMPSDSGFDDADL